MSNTPITVSEAVERIRPADADAMRCAEARQLSLTKPPGSLGRLEDVSIRLAGIFGTEQPRIGGKVSQSWQPGITAWSRRALPDTPKRSPRRWW